MYLHDLLLMSLLRFTKSWGIEMADVFVWSGAGGAADGSSWGDAYLTLMKDWGAEAGFTPGTDFVYVRSTHDEDTAATVTVTGSTAEGTLDPVRILCVTGNDTGTDPGTLTTGAIVRTNGTAFDINICEKLYIYGVSFLSDDDIFLGPTTTDHDLTLEECRLELVGTSTTDYIYWGHGSLGFATVIRLIDTDTDFGSTGQSFRSRLGKVEISGGSILADVTDLFDANGVYNFEGKIRNADLSIVSGNLVGSIGIGACFSLSFERCKLHANATLVNAATDVPGQNISFHLCQSGVDNDPAYQMKHYTYQGTVELDTARYRTGGATDQERTNPYSWSMDTSAGSNVIELYEPLESPPIAGWTDGDASTAHTYRIYIASGATLQNDEVWVDLIGPTSADTSSLGERLTTRPDPLTAPANITTDAVSTWNGADVGTEQQIDITYTPDKPGPIVARVYCAKPSERVSIDPKVYIDP
jgi:hypothetical protein